MAKPWTYEEDKRLYQWEVGPTKTPVAEQAKSLGRTVNAVYTRRSQLKETFEFTKQYTHSLEYDCMFLNTRLKEELLRAESAKSAVNELRDRLKSGHLTIGICLLVNVALWVIILMS
ncbi:MAG: hypothetical protein MI745_14175 [Pseudomonadales bacterium]|nr:hypothetical protein [Pseudomonadales bacterium]